MRGYEGANITRYLYKKCVYKNGSLKILVSQSHEHYLSTGKNRRSINTQSLKVKFMFSIVPTLFPPMFRSRN